MFSFRCGVNGIDYTALLAAVKNNENQRFNGVLSDQSTGTDRNVCITRHQGVGASGNS